MTTYVNFGGIYESDFELSTFNTRVFVGSYFYHYCGASKGREVEHYQASAFTDYHTTVDDGSYSIDGPYDDSADARYKSYILTWITGQWAGGQATCAAGRSPVWYKRYRYQDRQAVTNYTWTKESDWQAEKDSDATTVRVRYRLKDTAEPVIESEKVTQVTPRGYTIACRVSDDSSIAKVVLASWVESEGAANAKEAAFEPNGTVKTWEMTGTVSIADHGNLRDCKYYTEVRLYDAVGNETVYSGIDSSAYIPMVIHSARRLTLPVKLTQIEESAFDGSIGFGEVVLPEGQQMIGSRAFADCARLTLVQVPGSDSQIAADAFKESDNVVLLCPADSRAADSARKNDIPYITEE